MEALQKITSKKKRGADGADRITAAHRTARDGTDGDLQ